MKKQWASKYVGLPFKELGRGPDGYDCWGLAVLVYCNEHGVDLPSYAYTLCREAARGALNDALLDPYWEQVATPEEFDLVLIETKGNPHIGIYVGEKRMLHVPRNGTACIERTDSLRWGPRIEGFYRFCTGRSTSEPVQA